MEDLKNQRRFRINPVELAIFSVVALICVNSVYNLFYDRDGTPSSGIAVLQPSTKDRAPASTQAAAHLEIRCEEELALETTATKVRLNGPLCGGAKAGGAVHLREPASSDPSRVLKTTIVNQTNQFTATTFPDSHTRSFSTDYIPLDPGTNRLRVDYLFQDGLSVTQEIVITRNQ